MQMLFVTIIKVPTKSFQAVFYEGTSDKSAIKSRQTKHPFLHNRSAWNYCKSKKEGFVWIFVVAHWQNLSKSSKGGEFPGKNK